MDPYPEGKESVLAGSGVVQQNSKGDFKVIGKFEQADIMAGRKLL